MTPQRLMNADTSPSGHFQTPKIWGDMIPCAEKGQGPATYNEKNVGPERI